MKKYTKILVGLLAAALLAGSLSGCGAVGPMLIQLGDIISNSDEESGNITINDQDISNDMFDEFIEDVIENDQEGVDNFLNEIAAEEQTGAEDESAASEEAETSSDEAQTPTDGMEETTAADQPESTGAQQDADSVVKSDLLPEYEHYDPTQFYKDCEEMITLAENGKSEESNKIYDALYKEIDKINDLYTIADINAYANTSSDECDAEKEYMYDVVINTADVFSDACRKVMESKGKEAFKTHLNDDVLIDYYENYDAYTEEEKALFSEETKLKNNYFDVIDNLKNITCEYKGKEYTFGDVIDNGEAMYAKDMDAYLAVFENCYKQLNEQAGEIFLKLVKIRDQIAKLRGYDNYNDYADEELYDRTYSESDMEKMKSAARRFGAEYESYYYYAYQNLPEYKTDTPKLLADAKDCITGISPLADKAFRYFEENNLYSIGPESQRADVGFTTEFYQSKTPFIFIKTTESANDLITLTHEFGHFTDGYFNPPPYPLFSVGSYDIFEIHSTGLQLLAGDKYDKIFGEDADMVRAYNLLSLMTYITDGCIYDEWQREIYKNPDMTLDEINALFKKVSDEYGVAEYTGSEYSWVEVSHNFDSPLYYFSYAGSAFATLQIWLESREDFGNAVSMWEKIVSEGAYDSDYMELLKEVGLKTFDDSNTVYNVLSDTFRYGQSYLLGGMMDW